MEKETNKTIVLVRRAALGDVLLTTPIIRALRHKYPDADLYLSTECPQLVRNNENLSAVIPYPYAGDIPDATIIDLSYEKEPMRNIVDVYAEQAGVADVLEITGRELDMAFGYDKLLDNAPYVVVHTGRSWANKEWLWEYWEEMLLWLIERGFRVVQIGNDSTKKLGNTQQTVDVRGCTWEHSVSMIRFADFFIGIDSAPAHVAKACQTPAFVLYGPIAPFKVESAGIEYSFAHGRECGQWPCLCTPEAEYVECGHVDGPCIRAIKPSVVKESIDQWIEWHTSWLALKARRQDS